MNINDIMLRDITESDRLAAKEAEAKEREDKYECGIPWAAVLMWFLLAAAALGVAFAAGIYWQTKRDLEETRKSRAIDAAWHNSKAIATEWRECAPAN